MDMESARQLYEDNLSGRDFAVKCRGGEVFYVYFRPWQFDHLAGAGSPQWQDEKLAVLPSLCYTSKWKMAGGYVDSMGDLLEADIVIGSTAGMFGFREDEENEGWYYPCTCLSGDIRNYCQWDQVIGVEQV